MNDHDEAETARTSQTEPTAGAEPARSPDQGREATTRQRGTQRTRTSGIWTAVALAVIVLLLLLIFILQNLQPVTVSYFGATGNLPLGVALLFGAVGGALLVVVVGVARILQLRHQAWRYRREQRKQQRGGEQEEREGEGHPAGEAE